jgi:hypothetical protein
LETKGMGRLLPTEGSKAAEDWKTYSWPLSGLIFFNKSVITVLYVERTLAMI